MLVPLSVSEADHFELRVDGHRVPFVRVVEATSQWREWEPTADSTDSALAIMAAVRAGERVFNLTLDDRYGLTATESEVENWAWFLANAMAVSAGYTSHGQQSRPLNRHGPSVS